jgi:soluble lytic murein transglycosylase-like protein
VPERWVREVMQQESGGRLYGDGGGLITSSAGAMGLMQVMPRTYEMLRDRYGLGDDPYEPRNNIRAGTAYIREMYDRFGAPNFLAAYNAGPDRADAYLADGTPLPDETVNYLASVAPRLGSGVAMTGPMAGFGGVRAPSAVADANHACRSLYLI